MAKTMPGVESFEIADDTHWSAKVKVPLGLGGLKMSIAFTKLEERPLEFASLNAKGQGVGALIVRWGPERERLGARRLAGLLVGLAGVGALVGFEVGAGDRKAIVAIAFVVVGYAVGPVILSRTLSDLPSLGVVAASLGLAALAYVPAGVALAPPV